MRERVDVGDFIVAFYRCWVDDAVSLGHDRARASVRPGGGYLERVALTQARRWLFTDRLETSLAAFDYAPGYARKFRTLYINHERRQHLAWRQRASRITSPRGRGAEGGTMLSVEEYATLKALAKKAGISIRSIPKPLRLSLSRDDARKLTTLLMDHERVVVTRRGKALVMLSWEAYTTRVRTAKHARTFVNHTAATPNGAPTKSAPHIFSHPCCGSKGPRHFKSCPQAQYQVANKGAHI